MFTKKTLKQKVNSQLGALGCKCNIFAITPSCGEKMGKTNSNLIIHGVNQTKDKVRNSGLVASRSEYPIPES